MAKKKESKNKEKERLEKMKERIKKLEDEKKKRDSIEKAEKRLRELRREKNKTPTRAIQNIPTQSGVNIRNLPIIKDNQKQFVSTEAVQRPISKTNQMWLTSVWEKRKELDPEQFDPDAWFNSFHWMDNPQIDRNIDSFWTGDSIQEKKNQNAENYWMRDTLWKR